MCHCIELGAYEENPDIKQYYLAQAIKLSTIYYKYDITDYLGEVDQGKEPLDNKIDPNQWFTIACISGLTIDGTDYPSRLIKLDFVGKPDL